MKKFLLCLWSLSRVSLKANEFLKTNFVCFRYATLLFKKQRYVSGQHKVNLKIICKENYKYEVQEKSPANQAVTVQQLAEEYWRFVLQICTIYSWPFCRIDKFFLKVFPSLFCIFNIIYWGAFIWQNIIFAQESSFNVIIVISSSKIMLS